MFIIIISNMLHLLKEMVRLSRSCKSCAERARVMKCDSHKNCNVFWWARINTNEWVMQNNAYTLSLENILDVRTLIKLTKCTTFLNI